MKIGQFRNILQKRDITSSRHFLKTCSSPGGLKSRICNSDPDMFNGAIAQGLAAWRCPARVVAGLQRHKRRSDLIEHADIPRLRKRHGFGMWLASFRMNANRQDTAFAIQQRTTNRRIG
ncbi:hypothetical protein AA100600_0083 [Gluconobacter thailandicus F149-1 = NBRC 100600]|nr:hypothetical protein AA100600_0083 [Gluconobacter thailandicus F149-1 = NBRC 100600]